MKRKYGNKKTVLDGIAFDSKKEAGRYAELKLMQKAGEIIDLVLQPSFELIPKQRRNDGKAEIRCVYIADFAYTDVKTNEHVIEDVKGVKTRDYVIKRKLMLQVHGISVKEM